MIDNLNIILSNPSAGGSMFHKNQPSEGSPEDIIVVVDRSASMTDQGRDAAAMELADRLAREAQGAGGRFGLVAYSGGVTPLLDLRAPGAARPGAAMKAVQQLPTVPMRGSDGEASAVRLAVETFRDRIPGRVVVLTDGQSDTLETPGVQTALRIAEEMGVRVGAVLLGPVGAATAHYTDVLPLSIDSHRPMSVPPQDPRDLADSLDLQQLEELIRVKQRLAKLQYGREPGAITPRAPELHFPEISAPDRLPRVVNLLNRVGTILQTTPGAILLEGTPGAQPASVFDRVARLARATVTELDLRQASSASLRDPHGRLQQALRDGHYVHLRHLDRATPDVVETLYPVLMGQHPATQPHGGSGAVVFVSHEGQGPFPEQLRGRLEAVHVGNPDPEEMACTLRCNELTYRLLDRGLDPVRAREVAEKATFAPNLLAGDEQALLTEGDSSFTKGDTMRMVLLHSELTKMVDSGTFGRQGPELSASVLYELHRRASGLLRSRPDAGKLGILVEQTRATYAPWVTRERDRAILEEAIGTVYGQPA
ncbi:MAG: VWA domain-containing protein [Candidatus Eremiobacterota bacterium]